MPFQKAVNLGGRLRTYDLGPNLGYTKKVMVYKFWVEWFQRKTCHNLFIQQMSISVFKIIWEFHYEFIKSGALKANSEPSISQLLFKVFRLIIVKAGKFFQTGPT